MAILLMGVSILTLFGSIYILYPDFIRQFTLLLLACIAIITGFGVLIYIIQQSAPGESRYIFNVAEYIQLFIAIILVLNLLAFWSQYKLTQILNQPICGVKEVNVIPARDNIIEIYAIITNAGNYAAKEASITWEFGLNENWASHNASYTKIQEWTKEQKSKLTILPRHEFKMILLYKDTKDIEKIMEGYKKALLVKLVIEYKDMNKIIKQYSCSYRITRLLLDNKQTYECTILESK